MRSLNSLVTDSAAASSSWGSGSRVLNGSLNVLPDGRDLKPLCGVFNEAGWKRGLVTTTEITHATPAGFAANVKTREDGLVIATQYLERKIDVLLGGGKKYFDPAARKDKRDLYAEFKQAGYNVALEAKDLDGFSMNQRWLGTFASGHLPYTIDQIHDPKLIAKVPTLAHMTKLALKKLEREDHFLLQVEGGRVDHGAHNNDIATALREMVAFDEALEVCLAFRERFPDTLIVITTDHGTGNPGLAGMGTDYKESSPLFAHTLLVQKSASEILKPIEKTPTVEGLKKTVKDCTGYKVPEEKAAKFIAYVEKKDKPLFDGLNATLLQFGQLMGNYLGVGWTSGSHSSDYVPLLAVGPGSELFRGLIQNTDVFRHYLDLAGIDFRNPEMPLVSDYDPRGESVEAVAEYAFV